MHQSLRLPLSPESYVLSPVSPSPHSRAKVRVYAHIFAINMSTAASASRGKPARAGAALRGNATSPPVACTGARLRRLTRRVTAFYEHHMRESGLKLSQYSLLAQLSEIPQSLTALADRMEIDQIGRAHV